MKSITILLIMMELTTSITAQEKNPTPDIWSGTYIIRAYGNISVPGDTLIIEKTADANADEILDKYKSDLNRWTVSTKRDTTEHKVVRRFLFNPEEKRNQYEEFGWTDLHKSGKMECIDGGNFFICHTVPNTTVLFNKEESYFTRTGILAIWLHYGLYELQKMEVQDLPIIRASTEGDFDGDGEIEYAVIIKTKAGQGNLVEEGTSDEYEVQFSGNNRKAIKVGCCDARLINEGDLNNDGADEFSVFQAPMNGCTYTMTTYSLVNKIWKRIHQFLVPTACEYLTEDDLQKLVFQENNAIYYLDKDPNDETGKWIKKKISK